MKDLEEEESNRVYWIPMPLVKQVASRPESTLFLLLKLYEKCYPDAKVEDYYAAIEEYLNEVKFELEAIGEKPDDVPKSEQN